MSRKNVRPCLSCGATIHPTTDQINRGRGHFCSTRCSNLHRRRPLAKRFAEGVGETTETGCILWKGSTNARISSGGRGGALLVVYRVAYELAVGPIPDGLFVLHRCDNGHLPCINPAHLFLGTQADNIADMVSKNRQARASRLPQTKLTTDGVREIRHRVSQGQSQKSLAKEFGVSRAAVCLIVSRKNWAHVE